VLEEIGERSLRAALIRRQPRERAEVGVGVDGDRAQLEMRREQENGLVEGCRSRETSRSGHEQFEA
jgi:hypothetical protein